ncbi:hypothetical protein [Nocardia sp. CA-145437]|uniref:hypothetical protein n=1 Tax=Nocardia sp. CA-145437 TaxID=3239980 RepID=UPI003D980CD4
MIMNPHPREDVPATESAEREDLHGDGRSHGDGDPGRLRDQWRDIQAGFVDDPKDAVTRADALVGDALEQLTDQCSRRREQLESEWARGEAADTEALRTALRGYRDLFDQLVGGTASGATNM